MEQSLSHSSPCSKRYSRHEEFFDTNCFVGTVWRSVVPLQEPPLSLEAIEEVQQCRGDRGELDESISNRDPVITTIILFIAVFI
ncbi:hypothetical protein CRE_16137 [Caenorhabditis remanei]|uniref:Uncharacterized protein n=1 Tax=Caenorhabditis remanei TaxID=31234 RepID=E3MB85_CAERE|nr:hypothetical protein CRE_16137 [Caenorhabditis remanei]